MGRSVLGLTLVRRSSDMRRQISIMDTIWSTPSDAAKQFSHDLAEKLFEVRQIDVERLSAASKPRQSECTSISSVLSAYATTLHASSKANEADVLQTARSKIIDVPAFGGLGLASDQVPSKRQYEEALFLAESWLESLNSRDRAPQKLSVASTPSASRKPMTLAQKIFSQHALGPMPAGGLSAGDVVRVGVDWILASELSWSAMAKTYEEMGAPGIWRNDRFWLAGDHVVHPSITEIPKIKAFIDKAEQAKKEFKMTEYQGMNYTIMHTEFVRERAEPGMLCIGSDSHSCSAGAVGCLSIGLGTADVMMTLALGETWFKVPESILIELQGKPAKGISGKDVILYILKTLKRNTVAAERIVEFTGDALQHLSCDARFAIANMCTEFGAVTGVFIPDSVTKTLIDQRRRKGNKASSLYFRPDADAHYAGRYTIDMSKVEPSVAVYPNPDDVVPVSEKAGMKLDGVFIGACTTTEEELVLAALVLKAGLAKNLPLAKGKRRYVPGSLPIVERLRELRLLQVYEAAGFTRGPPGCSFCVGLSAEKAAEGETWLSSQNRNFKNRMGKGSIGHVTSAVVCAASAFSMTVTSPQELLRDIDEHFLEAYRGEVDTSTPFEDYVEPDLVPSCPKSVMGGAKGSHPVEAARGPAPERLGLIQSRVARLGDFVDTDAVRGPICAKVQC